MFIELSCPHCCSKYITKNGLSLNQKQQYRCKCCHKRFIDNYTNQGCKTNTNEQIITFTKEGMGTRNIARVLKISCTTVIRHILKAASILKPPPIIKGQIYEMDELFTYVKSKNKTVWLAYAIDKTTKQVVSFNIGARTNKTLNVVIKTLLIAEPKRIYTDRLKNYPYLIPNNIHRTSFYGTNHIERKNLSLRTHLKRLQRRTICFSKSITMLKACVGLYIFG